MPLVIHTFCQTKGGNSSQPGAAVSNVNLTAILPAHLKQGEPAPNADVLGERGTANVQLIQLADATFAGLKQGAKYKVTIEEE